MHTFFSITERKKTLLIGAAIIALPLALYTWHRLGYAASPYEALFMIRLQQASNRNAVDIKLAAMMPGEWEIVCYKGGYSPDLILPKFNKRYVSRAYPNDDGWDLLFIAPDGTHRAASGSCGSTGLTIDPEQNLCVKRDSARLTKNAESPKTCNLYTFIESK
jgi:hypothetical protein